MKRLVAEVLRRSRIFWLRSQGFTGPMANRGVDANIQQDALRSRLPRDQQRTARKEGFLPASVVRSKPLGTSGVRISERDYYRAQPLNGIYGKWLEDHVTARRLFPGHQDVFVPLHFHLLRRDADLLFIPHSPQTLGVEASLAGLLALLDAGPLRVEEAAWGKQVFGENPGWILSKSERGVDADGQTLNEDELGAWLLKRASGRGLVLLEAQPALQDSGGTSHLQLYLCGSERGKVRVTDAFWVTEYPSGSVLVSQLDLASGQALDSLTSKPDERCSQSEQPISTPSWEDWDGFLRKLEVMLDEVPLLRFVEVDATLTENGDIKVARMNAFPEPPPCFPFSQAATDFLLRESAEKERLWSSVSVRAEKFLRNGRLKTRRLFAAAAFRPGLVPYQATRWPADVLRDFRADTGVRVRDKLWAYRQGFLSYRLPQYGITRENRGEFVSDFDYRWIRHINSDFRAWFEDKVSLRYLFPQRAHLFPAYYQHVAGNGETASFTRLSDCPANVPASVEGLLQLVQTLGALAVKPEEGSHGEGFMRLEWKDGQLTANGKLSSADDLTAALSQRDTSYVVGELVRSHPDLAALYPEAVGTVRIIVYKPDGRTPKIGNVYLRLGTSKSGLVDNLAAGGMIARIDPETGRYHSGAALLGGRVEEQPIHPDTGLPVEGYLPYWHDLIQEVLSFAEDLPELEYLGFDVAITADGFKFLEVNRAPDYPRIDLLEPGLAEYIQGRIEAKHDAVPNRLHGLKQS